MKHRGFRAPLKPYFLCTWGAHSVGPRCGARASALPCLCLLGTAAEGTTQEVSFVSSRKKKTRAGPRARAAASYYIKHIKNFQI